MRRRNGRARWLGSCLLCAVGCGSPVPDAVEEGLRSPARRVQLESNLAAGATARGNDVVLDFLEDASAAPDPTDTAGAGVDVLPYRLAGVGTRRFCWDGSGLAADTTGRGPHHMVLLDDDGSALVSVDEGACAQAALPRGDYQMVLTHGTGAGTNAVFLTPTVMLDDGAPEPNPFKLPQCFNVQSSTLIALFPALIAISGTGYADLDFISYAFTGSCPDFWKDFKVGPGQAPFLTTVITSPAVAETARVLIYGLPNFEGHRVTVRDLALPRGAATFAPPGPDLPPPSPFDAQSARIGSYIVETNGVGPDRDLVLHTQECDRCDLHGAPFAGVKLAHVSLAAADLSNADLTGANLDGIHAPGAIFKSATLVRASLVGAQLPGASFDAQGRPGDDLFTPAANLRRANLSGANLVGVRANEAVFTEATLEHADLSNAFLRGAFFAPADLADATLTGAFLEAQPAYGFRRPASFIGAYMESTDLTNAHATGVLFNGASWFNVGATGSGATMEGAQFVLADLPGVDFGGAATKLGGANFARAELVNASFRSARLVGAVFTRAELEGTDFEGADLSGANLDDATVSRAASKDVFVVEVLDDPMGYTKPAIYDYTFQDIVPTGVGAIMNEVTVCPNRQSGPCGPLSDPRWVAPDPPLQPQGCTPIPGTKKLDCTSQRHTGM